MRGGQIVVESPNPPPVLHAERPSVPPRSPLSSRSTVTGLREIIAQARAQADQVTVYLLEKALREILKARENWRDGGDDA